VVLSYLISTGDKPSIARCRQTTWCLNTLGGPALYRDLDWRDIQRNPLSTARCSPSERKYQSQIKSIELDDHVRTECPRLHDPSTRQTDLVFPILRLNIGVRTKWLAPMPPAPHWPDRCLSSAAPFCPLMKGLAPSKVILGTPLCVSCPPTLGRLNQSRLEELTVILDCGPRYWYAVTNLKSPLIGLRSQAKRVTVVLQTEGPDIRVGGFKRYGEVAAWVEDLCQGLAEVALDEGSGGVVTVVNAGAVRPGDAGLGRSADHEVTRQRIEGLFKDELARVKGRVVKAEGSQRWKGREDAERVRVNFLDMATYLDTSGSREDLSEEEISVWM
jgi:hypothetical protein